MLISSFRSSILMYSDEKIYGLNQHVWIIDLLSYDESIFYYGSGRNIEITDKYIWINLQDKIKTNIFDPCFGSGGFLRIGKNYINQNDIYTENEPFSLTKKKVNYEKQNHNYNPRPANIRWMCRNKTSISKRRA